MIWALFNDISQRLISLDKWEQRKNLSKRLKICNLSPGNKVLDFGCGTGLFARVFTSKKLNYCGYDIDPQLISFARILYPKCRFTTSKQILKKEAPFDLILANCCFHHIDDSLCSLELQEIKSLLDDRGTFLMIDVLLVENDTSFLHRSFMKLERGKHIRTKDEYQNLIKRHFFIYWKGIDRSHLFSLKHKINPLYNDLIVFGCKKKLIS